MMGIVERVKTAWQRAGARAGTPAADDDFWYRAPPFGSTAGMVVNSDTAMRSTVVFACVKVISETVAGLPLILYERMDDDGKRRATEHPLFDVLHRRPNRWQTAFEFREMMTAHVLLRGNAYAEIVPGPRVPVQELVPLHPDRVTVRREESGNLTYTVRPRLSVTDKVAAGPTRVLDSNNIFHVRGPSADGIIGYNPIELSREAIGMALAGQDYAARFLQNDATPGGVLEHPDGLDDEAAKNVKSSWQAAQTGRHRHKIAVLEEGMTYKQIGMTNKDAQFLEARKFQAVEIARIFRMPPHKVAILDRSTFSNITQQSIEFVVDTITPWLVRFEQAVNRDLIIAEPDRFFAEFLVEGLLRGDAKARAEFYAIMIQNGIMTRNEVRIRENLNPKPGLDEPLRPLNMETVPASARSNGADRSEGASPSAETAEP